MVHALIDPVASVSASPSTVAAEGYPPVWIVRLDPPLCTSTSGRLAGLRFAVKDNIDVAGVPTTAACPAFAHTPDRHATVVQRLLDEGALLAGKTNLDQFACGLSGTRSPHGAVPNAFDAAYVGGGSSSGSAHAVATGEVDFALGTDTAGSGRVPAGLNNIVGLKPSRGLVSARGVLPAAQSVDCVSIFARSVAVAVQVLEVALGPDAGDPYSRALPLRTESVPSAFRFGVPDVCEFFGDEASAEAFAQAVARLEALGGTPVPIDYAPLGAAAALLYDSALVAERYSAIREFFDSDGASVIEPVRSILAAGQRYRAADVFDAQHRLQALAAEASAMWAHIDVLCLPTVPGHCTIEAMRHAPVERNRRLGYYTNFVNLLDYAALSVPSGFVAGGLPFGITLVGTAGSDWQLADLGQRFHHASGLCQGVSTLPLPEPQPIAALQSGPATHLALAVVGAHLSGLPLNTQLTERSARLAESTFTAPRYRLHALPGTLPPKPGLRRVGASDVEGASIAVEVWHMPLHAVGSFLALIPAPLGLGSLELSDGRWVHGFVCEGHALQGAEDISAHGGWRAYLASRAAPR